MQRHVHRWVIVCALAALAGCSEENPGVEATEDLEEPDPQPGTGEVACAVDEPIAAIGAFRDAPGLTVVSVYGDDGCTSRLGLRTGGHTEIVDGTHRNHLAAAGALIDGRLVICSNVMELSNTGRTKADGSPIARIESMSIHCTAATDSGGWGPLAEVVPDDGAAAWLLGVGVPADLPSYPDPTCGDGRCDRSHGEDETSCASDCRADPFDGAPRLGWVRDTTYDFANLSRDGRPADDGYWSARLTAGGDGTVTVSEAALRQQLPYASMIPESP